MAAVHTTAPIQTAPRVRLPLKGDRANPEDFGRHWKEAGEAWAKSLELKKELETRRRSSATARERWSAEEMPSEPCPPLGDGLPDTEGELRARAAVAYAALQEAYRCCLQAPMTKRLWRVRRLATRKSMPLVLLAMGQKEQALLAVRDTLQVGKQLLCKQEYVELEAEMIAFMDKEILGEKPRKNIALKGSTTIEYPKSTATTVKPTLDSREDSGELDQDLDLEIDVDESVDEQSVGPSVSTITRPDGAAGRRPERFVKSPPYRKEENFDGGNTSKLLWEGLNSQQLRPEEIDAINWTRVLYRTSIPAKELARDYPPKLKECQNKERVYWTTMARRAASSGPCPVVNVSRWSSLCTPTDLPKTRGTTFLDAEDAYTFAPVDLPESLAGRPVVPWHVLFSSHVLLLGCRGTRLLQDDLMALTHPDLASVAEMLWDSPQRRVVELPEASQVGAGFHSPTPILIRGVQRLADFPSAGFFGSDRFHLAAADRVAAALKILEEPTVSNFLAMTPPQELKKPEHFAAANALHQIMETFATVYSTFRAAVLESQAAVKQDNKSQPVTIIHTGNWGTGTFGNPPELMALMQLLGAHVAGVDVLFFHTYDSKGTEWYRTAKTNFRRLVEDAASKDWSVVRLLEEVQRVA